MAEEFLNYDPNGKTLLDKVLRGGVHGVIFVDMRNGNRPYTIVSFAPREFETLGDPKKPKLTTFTQLNGYPVICELNKGGDLSRQGGLLIDFFGDRVYSARRICNDTPEHLVVDSEQLRLSMERYGIKRLAG